MKRGREAVSGAGETGRHRVYLGLGSNLGDRRKNLLRALRLLQGAEGMSILKVSSVYRSDPWGVREQPEFLNMVVLAATSLEPGEVLEVCREVEEEMGRVREGKWTPRIIDVDILLYDRLIIREEGLIVPHPLMAERDFVILPLLEIDPRISIPGSGRPWEERGFGEETGVRKAFRFAEEEYCHG